MTLPFALGGKTIGVKRAPLVVSTRDNSKIRDWTTATTTDVDGCQIEPFLLSNKLLIEASSAREFSGSFFRVWMPAGTDVLYTDRLVIDGLEYDVYGQPGRWFDFEGVESHITVLAYLRQG